MVNKLILKTIFLKYSCGRILKIGVDPRQKQKRELIAMKIFPRLIAATGLVSALLMPSYASAESLENCQALVCVGGVLQKGSPTLGWGGGLKCNTQGTEFFMHWCGYVEITDMFGNCIEWDWDESTQVNSCRYPYVKTCTSSEGAYRDDKELPAAEPGAWQNWPQDIRDSVYSHDQCSWHWTNSGPHPTIAHDGYCCPDVISCDIGATCVYRP
jgi:hypothetical protein